MQNFLSFLVLTSQLLEESIGSASWHKTRDNLYRRILVDREKIAQFVDSGDQDGPKDNKVQNVLASTWPQNHTFTYLSNKNCWTWNPKPQCKIYVPKRSIIPCVGYFGSLSQSRGATCPDADKQSPPWGEAGQEYWYRYRSTDKSTGGEEEKEEGPPSPLYFPLSHHCQPASDKTTTVPGASTGGPSGSHSNSTSAAESSSGASTVDPSGENNSG